MIMLQELKLSHYYMWVFLKYRITKITGISERQLQRLEKKAKKRGYNPEVNLQILDVYITNGVCSGRPKKATEAVIQDVIERVRKDRYSCEKRLDILASEIILSTSSMQ